MKTFKNMCLLQSVLIALSLMAFCNSANAADNIVEEPTVVAIHAKYLHSLFLMSDGSLWGAGSNLTGALGGNGFVRPTPWIIINDVSAASAGKLHSLFLKKDGSVWAVGWVGSGALGDGFSVDLEKKPADLYDQKKGEGIQRVTPVRVMEGGAAISAGWGHSLFLKNDGSVWASGENEDGRLGDGTTSDKSSPVRIMKKEVAAISAGFGHSLFLKKDGSAWATGRNDEGQLGDGTTTNRVSPVQVMTDVSAISASASHSLFLKKDGTVWATGENKDGRLGDGTKINRLKPVPILKNVTAISAGDVHSLFLKNDGSVWGTGDNRFGQLGDALWDLYPADRHVISPVQITAGASSVSAGDSYSLFLMRDGSVRASGHNMFNNLGFKGPSTSKPTKISFRRRTPSEIKEAEKARDEIPVDPEKQLPTLTKPPNTEPGQLLQEVQKASKLTAGDAPRKLPGKNADKKLERLRRLLRHAPELRERLTQEAEKNGNAELAEWFRSDLPVDDGQASVDSATKLVEKGDWAAATDAYLAAYRANPDTFDKEHIAVFQRAGQMAKLAECFDEAAFRAMDYFNDSLDLLIAIMRDPNTRPLGNDVLKSIWRGKPSKRRVLLSNPGYMGVNWKDVPDPLFFLRPVFIPTDFHQEGAGWGRLSVQSASEDSGTGSGWLTNMKPLYHDREALRQLADEVRTLIKKHPTWDGGVALLSVLEAETGNYRQASDLLTARLINSNARAIPAHSAWMIGLALEGKDDDLDQVAITLYEQSLKKFAAQTFTRPHGSSGPLKGEPLRVSPLSELARLYGKYDRKTEARQLLYGLVDSNNQHPLVEGYVPRPSRPCYNQGQCTACHRSRDMNYNDVMVMTDVMTDIGYPVDSLLSLARIDTGFGNAFGSPPGWIDTSSDEGRQLDKLANGETTLKKQRAKAEIAVTSRSVIEALKLGAFQRSPRIEVDRLGAALEIMKSIEGDDEKTTAMRELAGKVQAKRPKDDEAKDDEVVLELLLSVRGEGEDARATVFSPVIDILKLAVNSKESSAVQDIAELDKQLVTLSEQHPESIEAGIVATVFAFLRNDLDSAKNRLKRLQAITDYPKSDGAAFWLAAQHALQYDQTRIIGAVLAERALTAAGTRPDTRLKEAILRERSGLRTK